MGQKPGEKEVMEMAGTVRREKHNPPPWVHNLFAH